MILTCPNCGKTMRVLMSFDKNKSPSAFYKCEDKKCKYTKVAEISEVLNFLRSNEEEGETSNE